MWWFSKNRKSVKKSLTMNKGMDPPIIFESFGKETVIGNYEFKIGGYSLNEGLDAGSYDESNPFSVGGYEWTIRFYPQSSFIEYGYSAYVALHIALASDATNVRATMRATLVDQRSGMDRHHVCKSDTPYLFECRGSSHGFDQFYVKNNLQSSSYYIKDDCLLVRCRIGVVRSLTEKAKAYSVTVPPSNISQQFGQILESGERSNIRFKVGKETFTAHKFVLAVRSPVFKAQFLGHYKYDDTINILDMKAPVFKALLHFIYCDTLPDLEYLFAHHLLEAADRYGVERLRLMCESKICEGITIDTAATTLALAEQHHCAQLKYACFQFIAQEQNLKAVMQTDGFSHLEQSCPSIVCELMQVFSLLNL